MNKNDFVIVLTTIETKQQAEVLAQKILEEKFAACVQIQKIQSRYWWNGKIRCSDEYLLSIKTCAMFAELSDFIKQNHSYETPEIVQIPITDGSAEYLSWMRSAVKCRKANENNDHLLY
ncbi:MAG: divalent-cation tolerance protein CutA [Holosporaceae bacterium]|jgi:periplasmic divalent cation tolerance protein|nr:divalent-cation tolerance protein CutA [Holosporaceae bacterium]